MLPLLLPALLPGALAAEPIVERSVPAYPTSLPLRVSPRWTDVDRRSLSRSKVGGALAVGGSAGVALGTGLLAVGVDAQGVGLVGGTVQLASVPAWVAGPPVLLAGSMRSARALRERGVRPSTNAGAFGWALYAATPVLLAMFNRDADGYGATDMAALPLLAYGGAIGLGYLQLDLNRRARRRAGLPSLRRPPEPL